MRKGIDVFPSISPRPMDPQADTTNPSTAPKPDSLGKSRKAATIAVAETALSRVLNSTPVMVLPAIALVRLQRTAWLAQRPRMVLPVNLGLILTTSVFALPLALGAFPQRQAVDAGSLEEEFWGRGGEGGWWSLIGGYRWEGWWGGRGRCGCLGSCKRARTYIERIQQDSEIGILSCTQPSVFFLSRLRAWALPVVHLSLQPRSCRSTSQFNFVYYIYK